MDIIRKIQDKPYETRVRILWATVGIAGIVLVAIFVFNTKNSLKDVDGKELINIDVPSTTAMTQTPYASVERVERTEKVLKIYFNFNNPTDDILNVSKLSDISLSFDNSKLNPKNITDRQGQAFVQKILSHTQNFGILVFDPINSGQVTLTFDQMSLEKNPNNIFRQELNLNLDELTETINPRN
jgi:hypothetical protein